MINPHNAHLSIFTAVPGWEKPHEQGLLLSLATSVPSRGMIVEIGSELGMSASLFATGAPEAFIVCIDINPNAPYVDNLEEVGISTHYRIRSIYTDSKELDWLEWCKSQLGAAHSIDLLFVDGDHSYDGALSDLTRYTPHVKHGGFLAVHDCAVKTNIHPHESHYEVYNAVHKWLAENGSRDGFRFMFSVDSTMVFRRMK